MFKKTLSFVLISLLAPLQILSFHVFDHSRTHLFTGSANRFIQREVKNLVSQSNISFAYNVGVFNTDNSAFDIAFVASMSPYSYNIGIGRNFNH